ncbi:hypothetical protein ACU686_42265 [Yinghuangia aomiensis]
MTDEMGVRNRPGDSAVVSADGTAIACTATGAGPAVVFVDGALCHRAFGPGPADAVPAAALGEFFGR